MKNDPLVFTPSPELLAKIKADLADGWSWGYSLGKNRVYPEMVHTWAGQYPEWRALVKSQKQKFRKGWV